MKTEMIKNITKNGPYNDGNWNDDNGNDNESYNPYSSNTNCYDFTKLSMITTDIIGNKNICHMYTSVYDLNVFLVYSIYPTL